MGQTSGSDRNYIYKDKSERYRYMNTFYIFAVVILWVLFGVYLLAKLAQEHCSRYGGRKCCADYFICGG